MVLQAGKCDNRQRANCRQSVDYGLLMRSACPSTSVGVRRSICLSGPLHWSSLSTSDGQISIDWDLSGHFSTFGDSI